MSKGVCKMYHVKYQSCLLTGYRYDSLHGVTMLHVNVHSNMQLSLILRSPSRSNPVSRVVGLNLETESSPLKISTMPYVTILVIRQQH